MPTQNHAKLKAKQRRIRAGFSSNLGLRVHRAISWLKRAELAREGRDIDAAFIFYWIAFNAAYAEYRKTESHAQETKALIGYFRKIIALDNGREIYNAVWNQFPGAIRELLKNHYVFYAFWNHKNNIAGYENWRQHFANNNKKIQRALVKQNTASVLTELFSRLYVLRNQLVHGGATWGGKINRRQVTDGERILATLVPIFVDIMMSNPKADWGAPFYFVVEG